MTTRLVDTGWSQEIVAALAAGGDELRIISPFIKAPALKRLLSAKSGNVAVITRFNLSDFAQGVSDISALRSLLQCGASVRGVKNLHAKLYLFGAKRAIVTSANLTESGLKRNHEFGVVSEAPEIIAACRQYFEDLWGRSGANLTASQLDQWEMDVTRHWVQGGRPNSLSNLADFGADASTQFDPPHSQIAALDDPPQAFVKFLGESDNRVPITCPTIEEIIRAGCHWAVAYPASKRPTGVKDGAVMFIARLTKDPNDIRVFGRAIGIKHVPGRDDASTDEMASHPWKATWPRYVRLHHAEFVAGTMANGVSLNELMAALGANSFASTQRNMALGKGNTDPRRAYLQQAAVELSPSGYAWLGERLKAAIDGHGKVPHETLDQIGWPIVL